MAASGGESEEWGRIFQTDFKSHSFHSIEAGSLRPGLSGDPAAGGATFWYLINTLPAHRRPARVKFSTSRCQHKNPANCHHSAIFRSHLSSCTTVPQPIIVSLHRIGHPVVCAVHSATCYAKYYCNKMKSETQKQRQISNRILRSIFVVQVDISNCKWNLSPNSAVPCWGVRLCRGCIMRGVSRQLAGGDWKVSWGWCWRKPGTGTWTWQLQGISRTVQIMKCTTSLSWASIFQLSNCLVVWSIWTHYQSMYAPRLINPWCHLNAFIKWIALGKLLELISILHHNRTMIWMECTAGTLL